MRLAYKFRLYPTKEQTERLEHSLNLLRDFYNAALQERRNAWRLNRIRITCFDQIKQISEIRKLNTDYMAVQARTMQQPLRALDKAFKAFFRRIKSGDKPGYPRFKGKAFFNSIVYNQSGYRFRDGKLNLSLIGDLKIKLSRPVEGTIKEVTAKREGSKWFAIVSCDGVPERPLTPVNKVVGIDVGIENFATLSDGTQIENWRYYQSAQKQLRKAARRVARRKNGSNRRRKAVAILRNVHQKIFNCRHDFQHKISTQLIKKYDLIAVEKLNITSLVKGRLSKQITDAAWSDFIFKLSYKAESAGRKLVKVSPNFTSQDCSGCGNRVKKDLSVRQHNCDSCGLSIHRDWNAALNILASGQGVQALT